MHACRVLVGAMCLFMRAAVPRCALACACRRPQAGASSECVPHNDRHIDRHKAIYSVVIHELCKKRCARRPPMAAVGEAEALALASWMGDAELASALLLPADAAAAAAAGGPLLPAAAPPVVEDGAAAGAAPPPRAPPGPPGALRCANGNHGAACRRCVLRLGRTAALVTSPAANARPRAVPLTLTRRSPPAARRRRATRTWSCTAWWATWAPRTARQRLGPRATAHAVLLAPRAPQPLTPAPRHAGEKKLRAQLTSRPEWLDPEQREALVRAVAAAACVACASRPCKALPFCVAPCALRRQRRATRR
jgi:hypothetical protein